jgi:hypothetical protein
VIDHGALTDALLAHMRLTGELVGDGVAPSGGGWLMGQPNLDTFAPYLVIVDGGGVARDGGVMGSRPNWQTTWSFRFFGGSRRQCDWIAGVFRPEVDTFLNTEFGLDIHKVIDSGVQSLGPVSRNDQVDPPYWQSFDAVSILCSPKSVKRV